MLLKFLNIKEKNIKENVYAEIIAKANISNLKRPLEVIYEIILLYRLIIIKIINEYAPNTGK